MDLSASYLNEWMNATASGWVLTTCRRMPFSDGMCESAERFGPNLRVAVEVLARLLFYATVLGGFRQGTFGRWSFPNHKQDKRVTSPGELPSMRGNWCYLCPTVTLDHASASSLRIASCRCASSPCSDGSRCGCRV